MSTGHLRFCAKSCYDGCVAADTWLSVSQAQQRYGIPRRTLYSAITRKRLRAEKVGAQFLLTPEAVREWVRFGKHTRGRRKKMAEVTRLRAALERIAQEEPSSAPGAFVRGESSADECSGCERMIGAARAALAAPREGAETG